MFVKWELVMGHNFKVIDGVTSGETFQTIGRVTKINH